MSKDRTGSGSLTARWLGRLFPGMVSEPRNRSELTAMLKRAKGHGLFDSEALVMLGRMIRIGRGERGLTAQDLADRAGISRTTLSNIEKGAPGAEVGTVFELAILVGVPLFTEDERSLRQHNAHLGEKLTLLPKSVRKPVKGVDDDF